jgi:lysozyme
MKLTPRIALEIASHEAIVRQTYKDSVGVLTWSVGLTNGSGHDVSRYVGKPQSLEDCLRVYVWALEKFATQVRERFGNTVLTEEEFGGALSWHWNTGAVKTATWPRMFMNGEKDKAKISFLSWSKPSEIIPRRKKEAELLFNGVWSSDGTIVEFTKLTSRMTPDWSSAKKVEVKEILLDLMAEPQPLLPEMPPAQPTLLARLTAEEALREIHGILARTL